MEIGFKDRQKTIKPMDMENAKKGIQSTKDTFRIIYSMEKARRLDQNLALQEPFKKEKELVENQSGQMRKEAKNMRELSKMISLTEWDSTRIPERFTVAFLRQDSSSKNSIQKKCILLLNFDLLQLNKMNLNLKLKADYRQQPMKSPRNFSPDLRRGAVARPHEGGQLRNLVRGYRKQVELPINFQKSIFLSRTPQRCLQHNNILTLYCAQDKRSLCASCMYQPSLHSKHDVVPIAKATSSMRQQLDEHVKDINSRLLPAMSHLITRSHLHSQRLERQMVDIMQKINKFHNQLILSVNQSRNQLTMHYQQLWNRLRNQYSGFASELTRINQYVAERIREISAPSTDDNLLYFHNVAICLHKMDQVITPPFCEYQDLRIEDLQEKINQVRSSITSTLELIKPIKDQQQASVEPHPAQSLKKDKMSWIGKKSDQIMDKSFSHKKLVTRSPNFHMKNAVTQREAADPSPKRQPGYRFFQKKGNNKQGRANDGTLLNRKSDPNLFFPDR